MEEGEDIEEREKEDGLDKDGVIDIEGRQDLLDIIHGRGLVVDVKLDAQVLEVVDGVVSTLGQDQMIVGLRMIAMVVDIKVL
jgi:hypothetical protein